MKETINRRDFFKFLGFSAATFVMTPTLLKAVPSTPHIVVVGGGFAGSTCAKYLKMWGGSSIHVTIVEPNSTYVSPILSNLVLNNQKTITNISFNYLAHAQKYQITMNHHSVESINKTAKTLTLSDNSTLSYDYLVLATGIDFTKVNDYDFTKIPHAWIAGAQTTILKQQIDSMVDGDEFVMSIPKAPFRCPPGPYERACVVADYLKNIKRFTNSKVTVLDENPKIIVEETTFSSAFSLHGVNYIPNATVTAVDDSINKITYNISGGSNISKVAKVLNIIPNQKASKLIFDSGLNIGSWGSVDAISYESTLESGIFIIGDSQNTSQPKAGHIGNSEAKICADAILRKINNIPLYSNPKTNSACYSPISTTQASWLTAVYEYDSNTKNMKLVSGANYPISGEASTRNYSKMFEWSTNLFADSFL